MILGVGIDSVDIARFDNYHLEDPVLLQRIFSSEEIDYCLKQPRPAQHFAARFAAREAFYKAYQAMLHHYGVEHPANLLTVNKNIKLLRTPKGMPYLEVSWTDFLPEGIAAPRVHVSLTHTQEIATTIVLCELAI